MTILVLGQGRFSHYLSQALSSPSIIIPSRELSIDNILDTISRIKPSLILDMLDPSSDKIRGFDSIAERNLKLRENLRTIHQIFVYLYISTSNLYEPATNIIVESSPSLYTVSNNYLLLKNQSELIISRLINIYSILRLPTILFESSAEPPRSFFDDLMSSRSLGNKLKPRDGDDKPFTFIKAKTCARYVASLSINSLPPLLNISDNSWSTKYCLKNNSSFHDTFNKGLRISSSYSHLYS